MPRYTTCVIWLAFVPIYISTTGHTRATSMSITIRWEVWETTLPSLSAMVCLVILFSPKLYIILLHPEKNVRSGLTSAAKYKKAATANGVAANGKGGVWWGAPSCR